jgi:hypothetical protein
MTPYISNSNPEKSTPYESLRQVRMNAQDRLLAEAHLARAEAMVDFLLAAIELLKKCLQALVLRPYRRLTA